MQPVSLTCNKHFYTMDSPTPSDTVGRETACDSTVDSFSSPADYKARYGEITCNLAEEDTVAVDEYGNGIFSKGCDSPLLIDSCRCESKDDAAESHSMTKTAKGNKETSTALISSAGLQSTQSNMDSPTTMGTARKITPTLVITNETLQCVQILKTDLSNLGINQVKNCVAKFIFVQETDKLGSKKVIAKLMQVASVEDKEASMVDDQVSEAHRSKSTIESIAKRLHSIDNEKLVSLSASVSSTLSASEDPTMRRSDTSYTKAPVISSVFSLQDHDHSLQLPMQRATELSTMQLSPEQKQPEVSVLQQPPRETGVLLQANRHESETCLKTNISADTKAVLNKPATVRYRKTNISSELLNRHMLGTCPPKLGTPESWLSSLHDCTLLKSICWGFTRRSHDDVQDIFYELGNYKTNTVLFCELTARCYKLFEDKLAGCDVKASTKLILAMKHYLLSFDRYCESVGPVMDVAMCIYLPDIHDYRTHSWHGIPPQGWSEYRRSVVIREVAQVVLENISEEGILPSYDPAFFIAPSLYSTKLKERKYLAEHTIEISGSLSQKKEGQPSNKDSHDDSQQISNGEEYRMDIDQAEHRSPSTVVTSPANERDSTVVHSEDEMMTSSNTEPNSSPELQMKDSTPKSPEEIRPTPQSSAPTLEPIYAPSSAPGLPRETGMVRTLAGTSSVALGTRVTTLKATGPLLTSGSSTESVVTNFPLVETQVINPGSTISRPALPLFSLTMPGPPLAKLGSVQSPTPLLGQSAITASSLTSGTPAFATLHRAQTASAVSKETTPTATPLTSPMLSTTLTPDTCTGSSSGISGVDTIHSDVAVSSYCGSCDVSPSTAVVDYQAAFDCGTQYMDVTAEEPIPEKLLQITGGREIIDTDRLGRPSSPSSSSNSDCVVMTECRNGSDDFHDDTHLFGTALVEESHPSSIGSLCDRKPVFSREYGNAKILKSSLTVNLRDIQKKTEIVRSNSSSDSSWSSSRQCCLICSIASAIVTKEELLLEERPSKIQGNTASRATPDTNQSGKGSDQEAVKKPSNLEADLKYSTIVSGLVHCKKKELRKLAETHLPEKMTTRSCRRHPAKNMSNCSRNNGVDDRDRAQENRGKRNKRRFVEPQKIAAFDLIETELGLKFSRKSSSCSVVEEKSTLFSTLELSPCSLSTDEEMQFSIDGGEELTINKPGRHWKLSSGEATTVPVNDSVADKLSSGEATTVPVNDSVADKLSSGKATTVPVNDSVADKLSSGEATTVPVNDSVADKLSSGEATTVPVNDSVADKLSSGKATTVPVNDSVADKLSSGEATTVPVNDSVADKLSSGEATTVPVNDSIADKLSSGEATTVPRPETDGCQSFEAGMSLSSTTANILQAQIGMIPPPLAAKPSRLNLFDALWSNRAPEEPTVYIPSKDPMPLSKFLETHPIATAFTPPGTLLESGRDLYSAQDVLSHFRIGIEFVCDFQHAVWSSKRHSLRTIPSVWKVQSVRQLPKGKLRSLTPSGCFHSAAVVRKLDYEIYGCSLKRKRGDRSRCSGETSDVMRDNMGPVQTKRVCISTDNQSSDTSSGKVNTDEKNTGFNASSLLSHVLSMTDGENMNINTFTDSSRLPSEIASLRNTGRFLLKMASQLEKCSPENFGTTTEFTGS